MSTNGCLPSLLSARQSYLELQRELMNLAHSGATSSMVLERLVEKTGKSGLLQRDDARIEAEDNQNETN